MNKFLSLLSLTSLFVCGFAASNQKSTKRATTYACSATPCVYFSGDPNTTGDLSPWDNITEGSSNWSVANMPKGITGPNGAVSIIPDPLKAQGKVYKLTVTPTSGQGNGGDSVYLWNGVKPYAAQENLENWEHFRVMFPITDYKPTVGEWNWFVVFHNDSNYYKWIDAGVIKGELSEVCFGINTFSVPSGQLFLRILGGESKHQLAPVMVAAGDLLYNHWYDFLLHFIWSDDSGAGLVEWWLDGKLVYSHHVANLWRRPDGTTDRLTLDFTNYRIHATWNSTIYFSKVKIGAQRPDVAF